MPLFFWQRVAPKPAVLVTGPDGCPIAGLDAKGIVAGLDFLREVRAAGGRGSRAKCLSLAEETWRSTPRSARRLGASEVELVCLESRPEMPAYPWEIEEAVAEGVILTCGWGPEAFQEEGGFVRGVIPTLCAGLECYSAVCAPVFSSEVYRTAAELVIVAIGQPPGLYPGGIGPSFRRALDPMWIRLPCSRRCPGCLPGAILVTGPRSVVEAVAHGHVAAESIDRYLRGWI